MVHLVVNGKGLCFSEFDVIVNAAEKQALESSVHLTNLGDPSMLFSELGSITQVTYETEEYYTLCG